MLPMPFADDSYFRKPPRADPPADDPDRRLGLLVAQRLVRVLTERSRRVTVDVQNRVVLLDGTVECAATAEVVGGLAWDVPGVVDVRNSLVWPDRSHRRTA